MNRRVRSAAALLSCAVVIGAGILSEAAPAVAVEPATVATITRDGVSFLYSRVDRPVVSHPRGKGVTRSDFDGDGRDDLAVTAGSTNFIPGQDRYDLTGSVTVTYSAAAHQDTFTGILQVQGGGSGSFGAALATGDVNRDGYDDLVIGNPDEDVPGAGSSSGGVWVFLGSPDGLRAFEPRHVTQQSPNVPDSAEKNDMWGISLAVGDLNGDGRGDVLFGCPSDTVGTVRKAGSFILLRGSAGGLTATNARLIHQNTSRVPDTAQWGDRFGATLAVLNLDGSGALDVVVGAPSEVMTRDPNGSPSGAITIFHAGRGEMVPQLLISGRTVTSSAIVKLDRYGYTLP